MKPHYFDQEVPDDDYINLNMAKGQGCVPKGCLLGRMIVATLVDQGKDPCQGCEHPRSKCGGRPKSG